MCNPIKLFNGLHKLNFCVLFVCLQVFGYHHPKTERARKTLARPQYKRLLTQMEAEERERQAQNDGNEDENDLNEMMNNAQV